MRRRVLVRANDVLVIDDLEIPAQVLKDMADPDKRVLWAFLRSGDYVQPVAYDEEHVIWLQPEDIHSEEGTLRGVSKETQ